MVAPAVDVPRATQQVDNESSVGLPDGVPTAVMVVVGPNTGVVPAMQVPVCLVAVTGNENDAKFK